jgi:hypothetical protein
LKKILENFFGEGVKKPKNAYGAHKNENFPKKILDKFSKKIFSPETVERTLKS